MSTRKRPFRLHFGFVLPFLALALAPFSCGGGATLQPPPPANYKLVWSDEFSGPDGSSPDSSKWTYDIGGNGWGHNELQYYTNRTPHPQVNGGDLVLNPPQESDNGADRPTPNITSSRLKTH